MTSLAARQLLYLNSDCFVGHRAARNVTGLDHCAVLCPETGQKPLTEADYLHYRHFHQS